ncbi:uncharacterized protein LOC143239308 isoform X3 [Tachypleus tridentatus]
MARAAQKHGANIMEGVLVTGLKLNNGRWDVETPKVTESYFMSNIPKDFIPLLRTANIQTTVVGPITYAPVPLPLIGLTMDYPTSG